MLAHPRLVGPWDFELEKMVRYYLKDGRPFTVVVEPDPDPKP